MIVELYTFVHEVLRICFWTLPALIVGVVMLVMALVHNRNQKKREKEFEEEMHPGSDAPNTAQA